MNSTLSIQPERPDSPDALALIAALDTHLNALYNPENRHGLSVAALLDPAITFLVARWDGIPVGCGGVLLVPGDGSDVAYAELKRMYVDPQWRRRGVAQALLRELERVALVQGFTIVRLETGIYQPEAIHLYEHAGFTRCPAFGKYKEDGVSLCYEKHLTSTGDPPLAASGQPEGA